MGANGCSTKMQMVHFSPFQKKYPSYAAAISVPTPKQTLPVWRAVFVAKRPEQKATFLHLYPMSTFAFRQPQELLSVIHNCGVIVDP